MDNDPRDRPRLTNGFFKSNLFIFLLGQFCMFVFWLLGFAVTYGETQQKNKELDTWRGEIETSVKRMNEKGTNYSHYTIPSQNVQILSNQSRIDRIEEAAKRVPILEERVSRIDEFIKQQHGNPPR